LRATNAWIVVVALVLCSAAPLGAQDADTTRPPRIGLVLGGGGARGGIHVGVLRVLEELRVPVHAIAGTSMGAIVGGLYATGLSADEIEDQLRSLDWSIVFNNKPPRPVIEYRRKQDDPNLLVRFEVGFREGRFRFPAGVIATHRPNLMLKLLTLAAGGIRDFDELPIPFRAVATDIATGEMVVLAQGDLPTAILASMSIPGVFAPARIDGRLLVDGGLVRNLPIDVVRDLNVDIIIVVDAGTPLASADDLGSAVGVYTQTVTLVTRGNADQQLRDLGPADVVIAPALGNIGAADFHRITQAMEIGHDAAFALRDRLAALAVSQATFDSLRASRNAAVQLPVLDFVRVENESRFDTRVIEGRLTLEPGDTLDPRTLAAAIDRVYGMGVFERVDFRIVEENGSNGLIVRPVEKPWGPSYLRFGLGLTDEPDGNSTFELRANFTMTGVGSRGGDLRTELRAGEVRGLRVELYQPLDWAGRWFVAPELEAVQTLADAFESNIRIAQYDAERLSAGIDLGRQLGATGQLRLGVRRRWIDAEPEIGGPELRRFDVAQNVYGARFDLDRLDDVHFPRSGTRAPRTVLRRSRASMAACSAFARPARIRSWAASTSAPASAPRCPSMRSSSSAGSFSCPGCAAARSQVVTAASGDSSTSIVSVTRSVSQWPAACGRAARSRSAMRGRTRPPSRATRSASAPARSSVSRPCSARSTPRTRSAIGVARPGTSSSGNRF